MRIIINGVRVLAAAVVLMLCVVSAANAIGFAIAPGGETPINLGSYAPGQKQYWQPTSGVSVYIDNSTLPVATLRINNSNPDPKMLVHSNPLYYIPSDNTSFIYHAKAYDASGPTWVEIGGIINDNKPLKTGISAWDVYTIPANTKRAVIFWFDLLVPFKISGQVTPLGQYSTTLVFTII